MLISKMDPIKYIFEKPALTGKIAHWQMLLSEYDIQCVTRKAIKGSVLSEHLAYQPLDEYQTIPFDFPDEDIMVLNYKEPIGDDEGLEPGARWKLAFDGASNAMGHGIGVVLISPRNGYTPLAARLCFDCTNNIAEYEACIVGLEAAIDLRVKIFEVYGDSALVICQVKGEWETRHPKLIPYRAYVMELAKHFDEITFHHFPREENQVADVLATLSAMYKVNFHNEAPLIKVERRDEPAVCTVAEVGLGDKPWFYDIKRYLAKQEYPENASSIDKKTMRRLAAQFFLNEEVLYKRNHDMVLLRCVDKRETDLLITEIHEGSFGTHANGHAMAKKILRAGYYWSTMEADCFH
jgi:ribonuclease HI